MKVFPCKKDKTPLLKSWQTVATDDSTAHANWHDSFPGHLIGAPTGRENGFVVVDLDEKHGAPARLPSLGLPDTLTVRTQSGGLHLYFEYPFFDEIRNKQAVDGIPGFDIRGEGGYVIVPPSEGYEVIRDIAMAELPEVWLQKLKYVPAPTTLDSPVELPKGEKGALNKRTLRFVAQGAIPGQWHQELYQAAMNAKQNGYSHDECIDLLSKATGHLDDSHDLPTIYDVYKNRTPKYEPDVQPLDERPYELASSMFIEYRSYISDPRKTLGTPCGIPSLDALLGGGMRPGEVVGVLAQAKAGKSSFTHKIIAHWLAQGMNVGYASRELRPATEVIPNLLSIALKRNALRPKDFPFEAAEKLVSDWGLYFSKGLGAMTIDEIYDYVGTLVTEKGVQLFVFDHLIHFVNDEDYKAISLFARELKKIAQEKNITIVLVIQPTKLQPDQRVSFNTIRGGAAVGQAIDNLIVLERVPQQTNVTEVRLDIARHKLATPGTIYLQYDKETMDFTEVEPEESPADEVASPTALSGQLIDDDIPVADRGRAASPFQRDKLLS